MRLPLRRPLVPRDRAVLLGVLLLAAAPGWWWGHWVEGWLGLPPAGLSFERTPDGPFSFAAVFWWLGAIVAVLAAGGLGFFRVARRHPLFDPGYRAWLAASPWEPGRPLPLGPFLPEWRDFFWLPVLLGGGLWLFAPLWGWAGVPLAVAMAAYAGTLALATPELRGRGQARLWVLAPVLLSPLLPGWALPLPAALSAAWVAAASRRAITADGGERLTGRRAPVCSVARSPLGCSAPWILHPSSAEPRAGGPGGRAVLASVFGSLAAAAVLVTEIANEPPAREPGLVVALLLTGLLPLFIVFVAGSLAPPLHTPGVRRATGRWIVPATDAPATRALLLVALGPALVLAAWTSGLRPLVAFPIAAGIAAFLQTLLFPGLARWMHTGPRRLEGWLKRTPPKPTERVRLVAR